MKNIFLILLCAFGFSLNAQVADGILVGEKHHEPKKQKFYLGFNFAPQLNVVDFKTVSQGLPLHTLAWYDVSSRTSIALGYTVAGSNFIQALIQPDWYLVNTINTAGNSNFIGIGYTLLIPDTKEALFIELGSNYDRSLLTKSLNCVISEIGRAHV